MLDAVFQHWLQEQLRNALASEGFRNLGNLRPDGLPEAHELDFQVCDGVIVFLFQSQQIAVRLGDVSEVFPQIPGELRRHLRFLVLQHRTEEKEAVVEEVGIDLRL